MSRAFVKEVDPEIHDLPDRPVSQHPNLVTAEGLAAIERTLDRFEAANKAAMESITIPGSTIQIFNVCKPGLETVFVLAVSAALRKTFSCQAWFPSLRLAGSETICGNTSSSAIA